MTAISDRYLSGEFLGPLSYYQELFAIDLIVDLGADFYTRIL